MVKSAILTTENQWFCQYAPDLSGRLNDAPIYYRASEITDEFDILFILGCHEIVEKQVLAKNKYNLVIHESNLPRGKGWAPLFWQIVEGKNTITFSLIEAALEVDAGPIYLQKDLVLSGYELNSEIRQKQAVLSMEMCLDFVENLNTLPAPKMQSGEESFYPKRSPADSRIDISKSLNDQFNLLRTVDNNEYPAFFEIDGRCYIIKIEELKN